MSLSRSPRRRRIAPAIALMIATGLAGCGGAASDKTGPLVETASVDGARRSIDPAYVVPAEDRAPSQTARDPMATFTRRAAEIAIREGKVHGAAAHLAALYAEDPSDRAVAFDFARHLRYVGALIEAEAVLADAVAIHGDDPVLLLERSKLMVAAGRPAEALPMLERLRADRPQDPGILQALGVALDRLGRHAEAQQVYAQAMEGGRPSAALLNNAGLSHLIAGDAPTAINLFRRATSAPGATPQVRMNLALALKIDGQEDEARRLAASVAPGAIAEDALITFASMAAPTPVDPWSLAATN